MTAEDQSIVLMESSSVQKHQVCPVMSTLRERARRIAFSCSTEEGSEDEEEGGEVAEEGGEDEEEGGEVAEEGSEDEEGDEEGDCWRRRP